MIETLVVLAKEPRPGRVKTRLVPPLTFDDAAAIAGAALRDTLATVDRTPARRRVLAFDGRPEAWLPIGWHCAAQPPGDLDERITGAFLSTGRGPTVVVGMDTPQLRPEQLDVFDPVHYDACLGLADDGGYWAIGLSDPRDAAVTIPGVPMSTSRTGAEQLERLTAAGLRVQLLDRLVDVDTFETAREVADLVPASSFARALGVASDRIAGAVP